MLDRIWRFLTSTRFAIILFGVIACLSLVGTFPGLDPIYRQMPFRGLLGILGLCTLCCTVRRWKGIAWQVHLVHAGVILTLAGGMIGGLGSVATINVYEGDTVDTAFRWDLDRDAPLGFSLMVTGITTEFYPVPVKVGLLRGTEKAGLFTLKTGETFAVDGYQVQVDRLDPAGRRLGLTVSQKGQRIGTAVTDGKSDLPAGFPYTFKLVAFQNPKLKRMWVSLRLSREGQLLAEGVSEVNSPLDWNGFSFFNTRVGADEAGRPYAGIQIVKDPGRPVAFAGLLLTSLGGVLAFARRMFGRDSRPVVQSHGEKDGEHAA